MAVRMRHADDDLAEAHEINVTPFIDVSLVLLIIFMVAAPLATVDVNVDLPHSTAQPQSRPDTPIFLTLKSDHTLMVGDDIVAKGDLGAMLNRLTHGDQDQRVFIRGDTAIDYGTLMQTMNALRAAGYTKVALVGVEDDPAP